MKEKIKNCVKIIKLTKLMINKYADHEPFINVNQNSIKIFFKIHFQSV